MAVATQRKRVKLEPRHKTTEFRAFKGVNLTDARTDIDDAELAWLENAMTIGKGAIQILPGPAPPVATIAAGVASLWGGTINGSPYMLCIGADGSITQVTPGGVTVAAAPAGTVTTLAHVTTWQGTRWLIIDPTTGYHTWDGTTFSTIDSTRLGTTLAVFEGRVWIALNRTLSYSSPATYNDFTAALGAGAVLITDEAFDGNISALASALEQLWIVGHSAIDALSNVQSNGVAPVVTTFSITNIVTSLGTNAPSSVVGYLRALTLLAPFGAYALSGVTPQKLSDKLDGLFPFLTLTPDAPAATAVIQSLPVLMFLTTYTGNNAQSQVGGAPISMLLLFTQGKWCFAVQGTTLAWITTVVVNGVAQAWGTDGVGGNIYQLFGAPATTAVKYKVQSKLSSFGGATVFKALMKLGFEMYAERPVNPSVYVDSEGASVAVTVGTVNSLELVNNAGAVLQLINAAGDPLNLVGQGLVISRQEAALGGQYLGWTVSGEDVPYRIQAVQMQVVPSKEWTQRR